MLSGTPPTDHVVRSSASTFSERRSGILPCVGGNGQFARRRNDTGCQGDVPAVPDVFDAHDRARLGSAPWEGTRNARSSRVRDWRQMMPMLIGLRG